jgi:hypothetical protein
LGGIDFALSKFALMTRRVLCGTPRAAENVAAPPLTKGFALKVYAGTLCDNYDIENDDDIPIVVVTAVDAKHSAVELGQQSNNEKRFSLYVADGDDNIITVKIATQLNSRMASVQVGCVMKLFAFRRGFLPRVDDETPQHLALLVSNFQLCGTMEVKDSLQQKPTKRLPVDHPTIESDEESSIGSDDDEDSHYIDADDSSEEDDDNDDEPRSNWRNATCTNKRRLCHKFGYGFDVCVATSYRIEDFDLEEIAQDCWFVTKEVDAMTASEKRNVLYWWFMVNVYHIGGKGKRKCPPLCLIKAIRTAFPNPSGVPYVDFRRGRKRKR